MALLGLRRSPPSLARALAAGCAVLVLIWISIINQLSPICQQSILEQALQPHMKFYQISDSNVYLYSATYDNRFQVKYIRIFGMQNRHKSSKLRCRLRLPSGVNVDLPAETSYPIYSQWPSEKLMYHAYYYGCEVPDVVQITENVTLSVFIEDQSRSMTKIHLNMFKGPSHERPEQARSVEPSRPKGVVVCVKAIFGELDALKLVEWMEFQRLLGVMKIVMYDVTTVGPVVSVLEHYQRTGLLELIPFDYALRMARILRHDPFLQNLVGEEMLWEQTYLVSMNDCYYRMQGTASHVMIVDIDEVIVPNQVEPLADLVERAERNEKLNASGLLFSTAWHLDEYNKDRASKRTDSGLLMNRLLKRSPVMQSQPKAILRSTGVIAVNWHGAVTIPTGYGLQGNQYLPWQRYGYVHHFRAQCKYDVSKCTVLAQMTEDDDVIPKYMDRLKPSVMAVRKQLNLD